MQTTVYEVKNKPIKVDGHSINALKVIQDQLVKEKETIIQLQKVRKDHIGLSGRA